MNSPRIVVAAVVLAAALILPSSASAWKWTFRDFNLGGNAGTVNVTVKKCKGPKTGYYQYLGRLNSPSIQHEVRARMPAFPKARDLKDVSLTVTGDAANSLPPATLAEIVNAFTAFYEGTTTRYKVKKGRITFNHPAVFLFGSQVVPAGTHTEKFKPKPGC
jgi:hypothetical protein